MGKCRAVKGNGEPCKLDATTADGRCWAHSPENAEQRQRRASKGGKSRVGGDVKALRLQLQELTRDVINGDLETGRGAVANQLITTQIKLLEYERKTKDLDEILERLEAVEGARRVI